MKTIVILSILASPLPTAALVEGRESKFPLLVETTDLAARLSSPNLRILDARSPNEYRQGHIPGAVNLPASLTDSPEANVHGYPLPLEDAQDLFRAAGINRLSHVIVYDSHGHRLAARIFYVLEFFGHSRVAVLNGGLPKWQNEGRLVTASVPVVAAGDFTPARMPGMITTASWVKAHLRDSKINFVDARSPEEFNGSPAQGPRSGHIPGAVSLEWKGLLTQGDAPTLAPLDDLRRLVSSAGVDPTHEVVAYCQSGMRASLVYFALRVLGYPQVRMYDGSWAEWSALADLPVER